MDDSLVAQEGVRALFRIMGEDPAREGLQETPTRVLKAWRELTAGYGQDPAQILAKRFAVDTNEMVVVTGIPFVSVCEHHMLPFTGEAHVAYIPAFREVIGLSKIPRLVHCFAKRLQIQEQLTRQIASALRDNLPTMGVGVVIKAQHSCMAMRGVQADAHMVTSCLLGAFQSDSSVRAEFLALTR